MCSFLVKRSYFKFLFALGGVKNSMKKPEVLNVPRNLWKEFLLVTFLNFAFATLVDASSFLMQFSKEAMINGKIVLSLALICLYYIRSPFETFSSLYLKEFQELFDEHLELVINERGSRILLKVKDKVSHRNEKHGYQEQMPSSTILKTLKKYIDRNWRMKVFFITNGINILSSLLLFIGLIFSSTLEIENTWLFVLLVIFAATCEYFFSNARMKTNNAYRNEHRKAHLEETEASQNILQIAPLNDEHAEFLTTNYVTASQKSHIIRRANSKDRRKLNVLDSLAHSFFTIAVIGLKTFEVGILNINFEALVGAIALAGIYNQFTRKITSLIHIRDDYNEIQQDIKVYEPDFENINTIYERECKKDKLQPAKVISLTIPQFKVAYSSDDASKPFELSAPNSLTFHPGDFVTLTGVTGSGKSTLMKMLTDNLHFDKAPINVKLQSDGYAKAIIHQDKLVLGSNSVLYELTFGKEDYDKAKLLEILHALHLYEEISDRTDDVLQYLASTGSDQYSSGQKQRLALARTLLNVDETTQIVAFDEATNNQNDDVALQVLIYIKNTYKNCIVLFATHQVSIANQVATRTLEFTRSTDDTYFCVNEVI